MVSPKKAALFLGYRTQEWLAAARSVAEDYKALGFDVKIYDCSSFAFPRRIEYVLIDDEVVPLKFVSSRKLKVCRDLVSGRISESLNNAAENSLKSFLRNDAPRKNWIFNLFKRESVSRGEKLYLEAKSIMSSIPFDLAIIPNGRFVHEMALKFAADNLQIKTLSFELGSSENSYVISNYSPHSRLALQEDYLSQCLTINASIIDRVLSWLGGREVGVENNVFSKFWTQGSEQNFTGNFDNVFFTSSSDEIGALGKEWKRDNWEDQYDAFDSILTFLKEIEPSGRSVLRVHPNLGNKSLGMFNRETKRIEWLAKKHSELSVVWHNDSVNSYNLIRSSRRVFVSLSSIGVEATLLERPVWVTSASHYDEVIGVRKIFSEKQLTKAHLKEFSADFKHAVLFTWFMLERQKLVPFSLRISSSKSARALSLLRYDLNFVGQLALILQFQLKVLSKYREIPSKLKIFSKLFALSNSKSVQ